MDLDETLQVWLRPEKTKPCTFLAKSRDGFRREREKWVADPLFFVTCKTQWRTTYITFLRSISTKLCTNTRVQVVARDRWFHIPEKFPLRGRISQKTIFFSAQKVSLFVMSLRITGKFLRRRNSFHPLVDIPQIYPFWVTFAEGCTVFQPSTFHVRT